MSKTIELCKVRQGETFMLDDVEFVKLADDQGAVLVLTRDVPLKDIPFEDDEAERDDRNNYSGSNLEKCVERWLRDKHKVVYDALVERPIDLTTMDGMTDYGQPLSTVRALTIDEYRKYRRFIPTTDQAYWLATGWTTASSPYSDAGNACYVGAGGAVSSNIVYYAYFAARPALYLQPSILVSVEAGEEEKGLEDYTELELLDELQRRVKE